MPDTKRIPLNIVMTYPVRWGRYEVLRDFVQNFYDSVGYEKWDGALRYEYEDGTLSLWVEGIRFSYEWLLHIGASTKTGLDGQHAGYFGEGFKIASLCAIRDYGWSVRMASGGWELTVTDTSVKIDGQSVRMLAYDICEVDNSCRSKLTLSNLRNDDYSLFKSVLLSFYYPENPLLGEKIWEGTMGAVYVRGDATFTKDLPYTSRYGPRGAVFCGYQLLGSNPFDLVVCLHNWRKTDRERKALYTFDVVDVFEAIAYHISPSGAITMLEKMRRYWNTVPKERIDIDSWYPVICNLIGSLERSSTASERFRQKYPNLLCLKPVRTTHERNRRRQARAWVSGQEIPYRLVQSAFGKLGYPTLEGKCDECGGFVVDDNPTNDENRYFDVLENLVRVLYADFFLQDHMPERKVIRNYRAAYHGMATVYKVRKGRTNSLGLIVRYDVSEVYLKESVFVEGGFFDAVVTYVHELCHAFGGDASESFSNALTHAMEILLAGTTQVAEYRKRWVGRHSTTP